MSLPSYSDLGKTCRDFFSQGYYLGTLQLGTKSKTCSERDVNTTGTHTFENGSSFCELETRKCYKKYGLRYTSKWNTDGLIASDIFYPLHHIPGVTLGVGGHFNFESKARLGKLIAKYNHEKVTLDLGVEGGDEANLTLNGSLVLGYRNFLAGYQVSYDTNEGQVTKNNISLGYTSSDFTIHGAMDNFQSCSVGLHHKTMENMETGVEINYNSEEKTPSKMGIGVAYKLNPFTALRGKVNTEIEVGFGYEIKIKEGVTMILGALVDGKSLDQGGGHKLGMGLEFQQ